jgi:hypothetical protein
MLVNRRESRLDSSRSRNHAPRIRWHTPRPATSPFPRARFAALLARPNPEAPFPGTAMRAIPKIAPLFRLGAP